MDLDALRKFLIAANQAGYASSGETKTIKEANYSKSLFFEHGDFKCHDNWFGGEPYGGRTVVFHKERPVWMVTYYGTVDPAFAELKEVYDFLRSALRNLPEDFPVRGPKKFEQDKWRYENSWDGDLGIFSGEELIFYDGKPVYEASYAGGFVDTRKGE